MTNNWVVLKFGGSSVAEVKHWLTISDQVKQVLAKQQRPLLVLSALKNVSNSLEALLHQSLAGVHPLAIEHLKQQHLSFATQLGLELSSQLKPWFEQLTFDCQNIFISKTISPKSHARVLAIGELLSTTIGAAYLSAQNLNCHWQDARELLITQSSNIIQLDNWHHFTSAECHYQPDLKIQNRLNKLAPDDISVVVTQGFIASDQNGDTLLLGREGSDTSAAYLGTLLEAQKVQIWTDVPGVFTTNPQQNNQAKQLKNLSYHEAEQMALLGAKVLHARALKPVKEFNIPVEVKSTGLPEQAGSLITADSNSKSQIKAVVQESPVSLFELHSDYLNSISSLQLKAYDALLKRLSCLGYDPILRNEGQTKASILRYSNSDQAEPDIAQIISDELAQFETIDYPKINYQNNKALISLVGSCESSLWQLKIKAFCNNMPSDLAKPRIFASEKKGRISLLVEEKHALSWQQLLHASFIEIDNDSTVFGAKWLDFCSN